MVGTRLTMSKHGSRPLTTPPLKQLPLFALQDYTKGNKVGKELSTRDTLRIFGTASC